MEEKKYPVVIMDSSRAILDVVYTNEKGYKKSLENGSLWVVNEETQRLLPYTGTKNLQVLEFKESYITAINSVDIVDNCGKLVDNVDNSTEKPVENLDVIQYLKKTIHNRKIDMPEGSYTTHLFKSGAEKIRKKTGEEAIELILANNKESIVYEAADLIYHMMVLLESENIEIDEILAELKKR